MDCPASFLPSTIVHEMAHQRGIASEQECNFIAIAVSLASGDPVYRYSGLLMEMCIRDRCMLMILYGQISDFFIV